MTTEASLECIREWLEEGKAEGATHMVVACDTFHYEYYPIYVKPGQSAAEIARAHAKPEKMSQVMEVYSYSVDLESQLRESRAFHFEP